MPPGSQGYNVYAYVANNPTSWVDPSGHNTVAGTMDLVRLLPQLSRDAALLSAAMPSAIRMALAIGRNPASWTLSRQQITETLVFGVFSLVLLCGLIPDCMNGMIGFGGLAAQAGSDALDGVLDWSAYQLQEAADLFPTIPSITRPTTGGVAVSRPVGTLNGRGGPWWETCMTSAVVNGLADLASNAFSYESGGDGARSLPTFYDQQSPRGNFNGRGHGDHFIAHAACAAKS